MSLVEKLWRSIENPRVPLSTATWEQIMGEGYERSDSGVCVNRESALTYSPVWRGVFIIANAVGTLPLYIYERDGDGETKHFATDHPAYLLLRRKPNDENTAFALKRAVQATAILEGNGYAYIERRGNGRPNQLIQMLPGSTRPVRVNGILWYVVSTPSGEDRKIRAEDMLHIKGPGLDALCGLKFTEKARNGIGGGMAMQEYAGRYFSNGAEPRVVLEHPGNPSQKAIQNLRESWNRIHQGLENQHKLAILEEGIKLNAFGINPEQSQLIESRKFAVKDVANWLGLPPHLLGDESRTAYASLEQENQSFLLHSLEPWLVNWEEECFDKLLAESEKRRDSHTIEFMRQALMRADSAARSQFYHTMLQDGVMNRDEVRARENLNPMPNGEGKKYFVPLNMGIAGESVSDTDKKFKRDAWLGFQKDGTVADVAANLTDIKSLTKDVGLPVNDEYTEPYLPVTADAGPLVSGDVIKDGQGDIVGGDVQPPTDSTAGPGEGEPQPQGGIQGQKQQSQGTGDGSGADSGQKSTPAGAESGGESGRSAGHSDEKRMITLRSATRQLLLDATKRMQKRLATHAEKANKAKKLGEDWISEHRDMIHEAMEPAVTAYAAAESLNVDAKTTVEAFIGSFVGDVTAAGTDFKKVLDGYDDKAAEFWVGTLEEYGSLAPTIAAKGK